MTALALLCGRRSALGCGSPPTSDGAGFTHTALHEKCIWSLLKAHEKVDRRQLDKLYDVDNLVPQPLHRRVGAEISKDAADNPTNNIIPAAEDQWL